MIKGEMFEPIGEPIEGFQLHGLETPTANSYLVLPIGEDPNKKIVGTVSPPPLEFTLYSREHNEESGEDSPLTIRVDWDSTMGLLPFADIVENYFEEAERSLIYPDDGVGLVVLHPGDMYEDATINEEYPRPLDSQNLARILEEASLGTDDIESTTLISAAGEFVWWDDGHLSAAICPEWLSPTQYAAEALINVFDATRLVQGAPTVPAFRNGLRQALEDSEGFKTADLLTP